MSKLKFSPNLFLEVAELTKFQEFLKTEYKQLISPLIKSYGVLENEDGNYFKINKVDSSTFSINPGVAINSDLDLIVLKELKNISVSDNGLKKYVFIKRAVSNIEDGTVSVTADGVLTGVGTKFTSVLRGQPNFPTKVKLYSNNNTAEYEVVSVTSDTSAIISGNFTIESGMKYGVIGTFTPGFVPLENNKQIYEYDSCNVFIVEAEDTPVLVEDEYLVGVAEYLDTELLVTDLRENVIFNENRTEKSTQNQIASLISLTEIDYARLEMVIESAYQIIGFSFSSNLNRSVFTINSGTSNFKKDATFANSQLKDWVLLNRVNMKMAVIDDNIGGDLYINSFNRSIIESTSNDFIIFPNYSEIEYKLSFTGAEDRQPLFFKFSAHNGINRFDFPIKYGASNIKIEYRLISSNAQTKFQNLALANYTNTLGNVELLANSSLKVDVLRAEENLRNYS